MQGRRVKVERRSRTLTRAAGAAPLSISDIARVSIGTAFSLNCRDRPFFADLKLVPFLQVHDIN